MRLKIAFRNTFRNRRRTLLSVCMIAGGVSSILIFEGFARYMVLGLRETTIKTDTGHIQIASPAYWNKTAKTPKDALLPDYKSILREARRDRRVAYASGRLSFFGLLSKGEQSQSARGMSFDPVNEKRRVQAFNFIKGKSLSPTDPFQIAIGSGLAQKMEARVGDRVTLLGQTYDGTVNALDVQVGGIFRTAISEFDDSTFLIHLKSAQQLLDTDGVELVVVGLRQTELTNPVAISLHRKLGPTAQIKLWYELAKLYKQVSQFNALQNRVVELIILTLILLGILNTVGMSILERTGEIGTVRALGERSRSLVSQFVLEGAILGGLGALGGVILGFGIGALINYLQIPLVMPGASTFLTVKIEFFPEAFRDAILLAVLAASIAAVFPAVRASRLNISTALRFNL